MNHFHVMEQVNPVNRVSLCTIVLTIANLYKLDSWSRGMIMFLFFPPKLFRWLQPIISNPKSTRGFVFHVAKILILFYK